MFASFHSEGTIPSSSDKLNNFASGVLICSTISLNSFGGIPSTPGDLFSFIFLIFFPIISGVTNNCPQYGFRQNHSTEYSTLELADRIITQMDNNDVPFSIFLDLSKTFDTIDHSILLNKLTYYGLGGSSLNLLKSYLNNRSQYVKFENAKSDILSTNFGVPQGSVLGPLLFIIYINDFPKANKMFNFIMYADNTTLFSTIKSFNDNIPNKSTESAVNDE